MRAIVIVALAAALAGCKARPAPEASVEAGIEKASAGTGSMAGEAPRFLTEKLEPAGDLPIGASVTACVQVTAEAFPAAGDAPWKCETMVKTVKAPWGEVAALSGEEIVQALDASLGKGTYAKPKLWGIASGQAGPKTTGSISVATDGSGFYDNYVGKTASGEYVIFVFLEPAG